MLTETCSQKCAHRSVHTPCLQSRTRRQRGTSLRVPRARLPTASRPMWPQRAQQPRTQRARRWRRPVRLQLGQGAWPQYGFHGRHNESVFSVWVNGWVGGWVQLGLFSCGSLAMCVATPALASSRFVPEAYCCLAASGRARHFVSCDRACFACVVGLGLSIERLRKEIYQLWTLRCSPLLSMPEPTQLSVQGCSIASSLARPPTCLQAGRCALRPGGCGSGARQPQLRQSQHPSAGVGCGRPRWRRRRRRRRQGRQLEAAGCGGGPGSASRSQAGRRQQERQPGLWPTAGSSRVAQHGSGQPLLQPSSSSSGGGHSAGIAPSAPLAWPRQQQSARSAAGLSRRRARRACSGGSTRATAAPGRSAGSAARRSSSGWSSCSGGISRSRRGVGVPSRGLIAAGG